MAQYITLEEAAERLGLPTDDFKRRLKTEWTHVVPMRDGSTLRFRVNQIDELARQLGAASDPGLPLAALGSDSEPGSDDFKVSPVAKSSKPAKPADEPLVFDSSDDDIFSLSAEDPPPGAGKGGRQKGDSDVRLEPKKDSDVRLDSKKPADNPEVVPTEEISLDLGGPSSAVIKGGSSAKLSAPKSSAKLSAPEPGKKIGGPGSGKSPPAPDSGDSSEFELSLDADSDDFELQLNTDSSGEVDLGSSPVEGAAGGKSGVNLRNPGDSGISLEKGKKGDSGRNLAARKGDSSARKKADSARTPAAKKADDSDADFELSLDSSTPASGRRGSSRSGRVPPVTSDSDSEFELTLDDSGEGSSLDAAALAAEENKGDIFETDFDIPPMAEDSGSEAVALDSDTDLEGSGVEIALDEGDVATDEETGSQVVLLEEEGEATPSARRRRAADQGDVDLADVEDEESVGSALAGVKGRRRHDEDEDDEETVPSGRVAAPAPWGPLPALILFPAFIFVMLGGLMGYELLHTMMGYQQPQKPAAPLVRGVAKTLDMELKDQ